MKFPDTRRDQLCPTTAAAAEIKANGICRELLPRKDVEIIVEHPTEFFVGQSGLIESRPLVAKTSDHVLINVFC